VPPPARYLLRARDFADSGFAEPIGVADMARCAGLSRAHFSAAFRRAFGESPHAYLLTRRLERAAALLRTTDYAVARICMEVGLSSVGSFTTSFRRMFGLTPTAYRAAYPAAAHLAIIPTCVLRVYGRPRNRTFREDESGGRS
jgi:AraC-like DNA-binding protein